MSDDAQQGATEEQAAKPTEEQLAAAAPAENAVPPVPADNTENAAEDKAKVTIPRAAIKVGSQRENVAPLPAKPQTLETGPGVATEPPQSSVPPVTKPKFPPPRLRDKLSPELEQEIESALGDGAMDDILAGKTGVSGDSAGAFEEDSRHKGRVVAMHGDDVFVDIGGRNQGVVSAKQFHAIPEIGAVLEVSVVRFNDAEGLYTLVIPGAAANVADWSEVSEGMVVEATVKGHNKGGLECSINGLEGFMPVSQISLYRVEDLEQFVGQKFDCVITEANPERRNLVLSHRAVLERERAENKEKMIGALVVGQEREGVVNRIQPFGAFVDIGGIDGLIHVSQMSWDRVNDPNEILKEGQQVKVKIVKIDPETGKIGLSYRDDWENPWLKAAQTYPAKTIVSGTVTKLMDFGAFVKVEAGIEGLVHISELSHKRVFRSADVLSEGQEVDVQVISVDVDSQRMSLSMKALEARPEPKGKEGKRRADEDVPVASPPLPKEKHKGPLKGGTSRDGGGEQFGLNW